MMSVPILLINTAIFVRTADAMVRRLTPGKLLPCLLVFCFISLLLPSACLAAAAQMNLAQ